MILVILIVLLSIGIYYFGYYEAKSHPISFFYSAFNRVNNYQLLSFSLLLLSAAVLTFINERIGLVMGVFAFLLAIPNFVLFFVLIFYCAGFNYSAPELFRDEKKRMHMVVILQGILYPIAIAAIFNADLTIIARTSLLNALPVLAINYILMSLLVFVRWYRFRLNIEVLIENFEGSQGKRRVLLI